MAAAKVAVVDPHAPEAGLPVVDWVASPLAEVWAAATVAVEDPHATAVGSQVVAAVV